MKSMFRTALLAAGLAVAALPSVRAADSPAAPAAGDQTPAPRWQHGPGERLQRLGEVLNLTPEQKDQVAAIFKADGPQGRAIMNDTSLSRAERRARMREFRKDMRAKIRAVLTPEQQQKFDAMPRRGHGPQGRRPADEPSTPGGNPPAGGATPASSGT
ncbi:MAG: Spy/CpxP family protein refolding chaperone [Opitutaceae bacterium]|nr:Spy/CpxP family protein refolding chaperone [Opitutaceae bacterium]